MEVKEAMIYIKAIEKGLYESGKDSPYRDELIPKMKEACNVALKALKDTPKFVMGKLIASKFIVLTNSRNKQYVRADKIAQMYETEYETLIFLDGTDTPIIVKESVDEIFAKINEIY